MRYCEIFDPVKLGRVTLRQYYLMMQAIRLQLIDKQQDLHMQAWLNMQVKATKQRGKKTVPYFKTFGDFFKHPDKENPRKKGRLGQEQRYDAIKEILLKANTNSTSPLIEHES